eukprot:921665-Alexandrium_andersonii.AAC.1
MKLSFWKPHGLRGCSKGRKFRGLGWRVPPWALNNHALLAISAGKVRHRPREHECFGGRWMEKATAGSIAPT